MRCLWGLQMYPASPQITSISAYVACNKKQFHVEVDGPPLEGAESVIALVRARCFPAPFKAKTL